MWQADAMFALLPQTIQMLQEIIRTPKPSIHLKDFKKASQTGNRIFQIDLHLLTFYKQIQIRKITFIYSLAVLFIEKKTNCYFLNKIFVLKFILFYRVYYKRSQFTWMPPKST